MKPCCFWFYIKVQIVFNGYIYWLNIDKHNRMSHVKVILFLKMAIGHSKLGCTAEILMIITGNFFFIFKVEYKKSKINSAIVGF